MKEVLSYFSYKSLLASAYIYFILTISQYEEEFYTNFSLNHALVMLLSTMGTTWISQGALKNSSKHTELLDREHYTIFYINLIILFSISIFVTDLYFSIIAIFQSFSIFAITIIQIKSAFKHLLITEGARGISVITACLLNSAGLYNLSSSIWLIIWITSFIPTIFYVVYHTRVEWSFNKIKDVAIKSIQYGGWLSVWLGFFNYVFYLDRLAVSKIDADLLKPYDIITRIMPFLIQPFLMRFLRILHRKKDGSNTRDLRRLIQTLFLKFILFSGMISGLFWLLTRYIMDWIGSDLISDANGLTAFLIMSLIWQSATLVQKLAEKNGQSFFMCISMAISIAIYALLLTNAETIPQLLISSLISASVYIGLLMMRYLKQ
jgi:hypothetical protein